MPDPAVQSQTIAAVDLGSNSFHMIVARTSGHVFKVIDRLSDMVRLAAGLDADGQLSDDAQQRALECLRRFGERLRHIPSDCVQAVGTNTLRSARNADVFLNLAEEALHHRIEVIAGVEEARLIYQGVAHSLADDHQRRLVIDIGGGSTELIIGEQFVPRAMESLYMGCVSMSRRYFSDGTITEQSVEKAEIAALVELESIIESFQVPNWDVAIGASGTVRAIGKVVQSEGWSQEGITFTSLQRLVEALRQAGHSEKLRFAALKPERIPVFAGGVLVLYGIFKALGIEHMQVSGGALREGLLYDLLDRINFDDIRDQSVASLAKQYQVDAFQAQRVADTTKELLTQCTTSWQLAEARFGRLLKWASTVHELGMHIAHSQYHKHGAYILEHTDLAGFSESDKKRLAVLVRAHRRKFPFDAFKSIAKNERPPFQKLAILLRLGVVLNRSRRPQSLPDYSLYAGEKTLGIEFPQGWLQSHPLTRADLEQEADYLNSAGYRLTFT